MRFTKIPLIATLMAVALSLLIVLPALGQSSDITDGRGGSPDGLSVGVFDDINDAQILKLEESGFSPWPNPPGEPDPLPYIRRTDGTTPPVPNTTAGEFGDDDPSYLMNPGVDPQDTFFRGTLYVSNDPVNDEADTDDTQDGNQRNEMEGAYNTILINVAFPEPGSAVPGTGNCVADVATNGDTGDVDESAEALVKAIVRNNRSGDTATLELVVTGADRRNAQGFVKVVPGDQKPSDGPIFCADGIVDREESPDDDTPNLVARETADESATDDTIAQIPARHGDRITITIPGQSGSVGLTVDGDGPDFSAITPEDNDVTRSSRLSYGFEVRDDDSGLRHDGEAQLTEDDDYEEVNPDGDQHLESEPLSEDPGAAVRANGPAADIDVHVAVNPMSTAPNPDAVTYEDISASGTWRIAGSRSGVAYAFTASGADKGDDPYLYQLRARDRVGNWSETDADDDRDAPGNQPYVFRVDNEDPVLGEARTGISWNSEDAEEEVDRSYIALDFGGDAIGDVDTNSITVVGHSIVGYIHPSTAPAINRNEGSPDRADYDPVYVEYEPKEPTSTRPSTITNDPDTDVDETAPWTAAQDSTRSATDDPRSTAHVNLLLLEGRWVKYEVDKQIVDADTDDVPAPPEARQ